MRKTALRFNDPSLMRISSSPIFIVGAPRSGTTLFQYMLRSHPDISIPTGESHFFIPLFRNADSFGDLNDAKNITSVPLTFTVTPTG